MRVLMIVRSDIAHDARVRREAVALAGDGHEVHVIGRDVPTGWSPPAGVTYTSVSSSRGFRKPAPRRGLGPLIALARWALLPRHNRAAWESFLREAERAAGARAADVIHAHDFPVLPLAHRLAGARGAAVVYDSHEWWSGRYREGRPTPVADRRERATERRLSRESSLVLTVSQPIVERFVAWGCEHVELVRNTFPLEATATAPGASPAEPAATGVIYAGRIGPGRDIATLLAAAEMVPELTWTLMGPADARFAIDGPTVGPTVGRNPTAAGVQWVEAAPVDGVDRVLQEHGISLITLEDNCENHRVALPNKLFHAVRAEVPVVAADLPAMRELVTEFGLGELYRPGDPHDLVRAVRAVSEGWREYRSRVVAARAALSWAADSRRLVDAYRSLPTGASASSASRQAVTERHRASSGG